jgi:hypothetical protein
VRVRGRGDVLDDEDADTLLPGVLTLSLINKELEEVRGMHASSNSHAPLLLGAPWLRFARLTWIYTVCICNARCLLVGGAQAWVAQQPVLEGILSSGWCGADGVHLVRPLPYSHTLPMPHSSTGRCSRRRLRLSRASHIGSISGQVIYIHQSESTLGRAAREQT